MTTEEIAREAEKNPLMNACNLAISSGVMTSNELVTWTETYINIIENAFDVAAEEPKINSVEVLIHCNSKPEVKTACKGPIVKFRYPFIKETSSSGVGSKDAMRKHMTRVFDELLQDNKDVVYIGEDVEHGGYNLVTDGLAAKYPNRVQDFPPDETSIVGAGVGFSQLGLVLIVEILYANNH